MNKIVRRILITAFILCFVGAVFAGVGIAAGGVRYYSEGNPKGVVRGNGKIYEEKGKELDTFDNLDVNLAYSDLIILPSEDDHCRISYRVYGNKKKNPLTYEVKDGRLLLSEAEELKGISFDMTGLISEIFGHSWLSGGQEMEVIRIYIPENHDIDTADINSKSGDVSITGLTAGQMSCKISYGDLDLEKTSAKEADYTLSSGDLSARDLNLEHFSIHNSYGDVSIKNSQLSDMSAKLDSGDLTLNGISFAGKNECMLSYGDVSVQPESPALSDIAWSLKVKFGDLNLPGQLIDNADNNVQISGDSINGFSMNQDRDDIVSISIENKDGDITVR
ncbi:MAG: DUF4097 family beta strand repeat protein [Eubacterium sp.]|nr:DUF4097 family beta strand repeat protein [Eubacterium sp.]